MCCSLFSSTTHAACFSIHFGIVELITLTHLRSGLKSVTRLILTKAIFKVSVQFDRQFRRVFVSSRSEAFCLVDRNEPCSDNRVACRGYSFSLLTKHRNFSYKKYYMLHQLNVSHVLQC